MPSKGQNLIFLSIPFILYNCSQNGVCLFCLFKDINPPTYFSFSSIPIKIKKEIVFVFLNLHIKQKLE